MQSLHGLSLALARLKEAPYSAIPPPIVGTRSQKDKWKPLKARERSGSGGGGLLLRRFLVQGLDQLLRGLVEVVDGPADRRGVFALDDVFEVVDRAFALAAGLRGDL